MLVFISDLHLTDGTTCKTIQGDAFKYFREDLGWMAEQACRRKRGSPADGNEERPLERVDVVLLGDIVDLLRSTEWKNSAVRPWTPEMADPSEWAAAHAELAGFITRRMETVVAKNDDGLKELRELAGEGVEVTLRDESNREQTFRIPVRIWYMAGNHDWFLNVNLPCYDAARSLLTDAMGLANPPGTAFPHTMDELPPELHELLAAHRVYAQHGDIFDPDNYQTVATGLPGSARARSSLGDAIVIGLLNGLGDHLKAALGDDPIVSRREFVLALEELDNVRPSLAIPQWLAAVLQRFDDGSSERQHARRAAVVKVLHERLSALVRDPFVQRFDIPLWLDTVDTLKIGEVVSNVRLGALARVSRILEGSKIPEQSAKEYRKNARAQLERTRGDIRFVVLGHTHHPEMVPLDLDYDTDTARVYLNTGTWRRVHARCEGASHGYEFLSSHVMSLVAIYKGDERRGRPYETWTGTLGVSPSD